jgi:hypothetical protein
MSVELHSGKYVQSANHFWYTDASRLLHLWVSAFILDKICSACEIMSTVTIKEVNYVQHVRPCRLSKILCSATVK